MENTMPATAKHLDHDSSQATVTMLIVGAIALAASLFFTAPADAQGFGPEQPVQHPEAALIERLAADQAAFVLANEAYGTLVAANAAYETADAALNGAIETGVTASSPAENLGELAQNMVNARVAKEAAQAEFDGATAALADARAAYDAAVGTPLSDEVQIVEDDLLETNDFVAKEKARVDELESQLTMLKAATCEGHDYVHSHAAAYAAVCIDENTRPTVKSLQSDK